MNNETRTIPKRAAKLPLLIAAIISLALIAASCSDDNAADDVESDDSEQSSDSERNAENDADDGAAPERSPGAPEIPAECEEPVDEAAAAVEERGEPEASDAEGVEVGQPVVIEEGTGDPVIPGGTIQAHYSIINPADGEVLQSTWEADFGAQDIPLEQVPPSFAEAVEPMLVGGRTAFAVTVGDLGGAPPETELTEADPVVFVLDLLGVSEAASGPSEADADALAAAEERGAPEMSVPEGTAETEELVVIDDVVGEGAVVCPGDQVVAHYTGIQASDGEQFDSSWERGEPAPFGLDGVIQGWGEGLVGMQVGGRRTLVIPADLAYGDDDSSGGPTGTLVFTIDLVGAG